MNKSFAAFAICLLAFLSACSSRKVTSAPSVLAAGSTPEAASSGPEVATTLPDNGAPPVANPEGESNQPASASEIALGDNGRTFTYRVGDSFLLNLGGGYEWTVSVDGQDVVALKMGVMVIQGAQGIFDALAPGTAILTATGEPECLKSTPPCKMPTILFKVTLIVE